MIDNQLTVKHESKSIEKKKSNMTVDQINRLILNEINMTDEIPLNPAGILFLDESEFCQKQRAIIPPSSQILIFMKSSAQMKDAIAVLLLELMFTPQVHNL